MRLHSEEIFFLHYSSFLLEHSSLAAFILGQLPMVKLLLSKGASSYQRGVSGTPLFAAVEGGDVCLELLFNDEQF